MSTKSYKQNNSLRWIIQCSYTDSKGTKHIYNLQPASKSLTESLRLAREASLWRDYDSFEVRHLAIKFG